MAGVSRISAFGDVVVAEYGAGHAVVVDDVRAAPDQVPPENVAAYDALGIRAHVGVPVVHSDRLVSCIGGPIAPVPRRWKAEEVELLQAAVERTWLTVEVLRQARALVRESEAMAHILGSITDAFFALDREWRFIHVNDQAERLMTRPRVQVMGLSIWEAFPGLVGTDFEHEYRRAVERGETATFQTFYPASGAWLDVRAYPSEDGLSVFFQDVTEKKNEEEGRERRERRERFLADLAERARALTNADAVIADALHSVGAFMGVSRCIFADIDIEADTCTIHPDYRADTSVSSIEGVVPISAFGAYVVAEYAARRAVAVDDVRRDPLRAPVGSLSAYEAIGIRAHVTVPVVHFDRVVSCISVPQRRAQALGGGGDRTAAGRRGAHVADRRGDPPAASPGARGGGAARGRRTHGPHPREHQRRLFHR